MFVIATHSIGITKESLIQAVIHEYGFARAGERIQDVMQEAFDVLLQSGRVQEIEGKITKKTI